MELKKRFQIIFARDTFEIYVSEWRKGLGVKLSRTVDFSRGGRKRKRHVSAAYTSAHRSWLFGKSLREGD